MIRISSKLLRITRLHFLFPLDRAAGAEPCLQRSCICSSIPYIDISHIDFARLWHFDNWAQAFQKGKSKLGGMFVTFCACRIIVFGWTDAYMIIKRNYSRRGNRGNLPVTFFWTLNTILQVYTWKKSKI